MTTSKRIFVVGHMGAGKFIFTEALAKKLGWQLVDANPSIESYMGLQIREILGEQGEVAFNRCQADIISHYIAKENVVVLLEEYVVLSEHCRRLLSSEFVVYLQVSIPTQLGRMQGGRVPALPVEDMKEFLQIQHDERNAFYEEVATVVIESVGSSHQAPDINKNIEDHVNKVIKALEKKC